MSKLSTTTLGLTAFFLLCTVIPVAAADDGSTCPAYTYSVGDVAFNEQGQARISALGFYVVHDYTFGVTGTDYLFSIWIYQESNGTPGLQRNDQFCHDAPHEESDTGCFC